tara:strand:- start:1668 stop:2486 length:819 start_codon:yes stop_codon:yes gene_type:complete
MILWIASYPKSGNTWVRSLISSYLFSKNGSFDFNLLNEIPRFPADKQFAPLINLQDLLKDPLEITKYWHAAQLRLNLDNRIKFLKTHNACVSYKGRWFTDEKNTAGYIYIVRDPRSIACSNAKHSNISLEKAVFSLLNENEIGYNGKYKLAETPGSWKINYLSWKKKKKFDGIIIKYEDLIDNAEKEFTKILTYVKKKMNIEIDKKKIIKSVDSCQFFKLKEMEDKHGFKEATHSKFFRIGKKDSWIKELSHDLRTEIEVNFKNEMKELGYL